ncbi:F-box/FBD/LRR-repeat protein At5g22660-like [Spinacia oleracea]|uniref:F-box/FBD/LRR-repeat protein At5g22660-like n=1 Tax=Spinacia oleracea TaxID=3562 RepID=A0A9R0IL44_SPIOL|nr:F-box/FBD/LRR-repeat protein At5g22660-like [Spinacia oleracea]
MKGHNKRISYYRREDRLSMLPDCILIEILSFLPLKSAIVTSALSNRYRNLWPEITSLDIDFSEIKNPQIKNPIAIVDESFNKLTSTSIFRLRLCLCDLFDRKGVAPNSSRRNQFMINLWFQQICARNVKEIKVSSRELCYFKPYVLPQYVYQTRSLVELEIDRSINLGYRWDDDEINLPNLKKLKIYRSMYSLKRLEKFINSCPSLEDFYLEIDLTRDIELSVVNLSVRNLKSLVLLLYGIHHTCKVMIESPILEYFTVAGPNNHMLGFSFEEIPIKLVETRMSMINSWKADQMLPLLKFLREICHVRFLELDSVPFKPLKTFPNLGRLTLGFSTCDFRRLIIFLGFCPALEVLILDMKGTTDDEGLTWVSSGILPKYTRPKKIEIRIGRLKYQRELMKMVRYFVQNCQALEQLKFSITEEGHEYEDKLSKQRIERQFCDDLLDLPRSSSRCEIIFSGNFLKKSSNSWNE